MAAAKPVVVDVTCKDAEDFRAQQEKLKEALLGSDSGVSEIRLRATSAGCLVQVKEAHTGMDLTCLAWTFPSVAAAARAIGHAFEPPEPPHHELLERIIAYARTSDQRQ